jgi:hypothetical protein
MLNRTGVFFLVFFALGVSIAIPAFKSTIPLSAVDSVSMSEALKMFYSGTPRVEGEVYFEDASFLASDAVLGISCSRRFQGGLQANSECRIEIADIGTGSSGNSVQRSMRSDDVLVVKLVDASDSARLATSVFGPSFVGTKELKSIERAQVPGKDGQPLSVPRYRLSCTLNQLCQVVVAAR